MAIDPKPIVGRVEKIDLLDFGVFNLPAKVDTGADSSSIWTSKVIERDHQLQCVFFGPKSPYYTGETVRFQAGEYDITRVANSFGVKELRYKVKLRIRVKGKIVRATFTLSDRSLKTYPILLGRRLLTGKFLVDVSQGDALHSAEKSKAKQLKQDLEKLRRQKEQS